MDGAVTFPHYPLSPEEDEDFIHERPRPTYEEECAGTGHPYYGDEADCEFGRLHVDGEPCECGRCYCGFRRYVRGGPTDA